MQVHIRTRHLELSPDVRAAVARRLHAAFGRLTAVIRAIDLTLVDINGPRGGADTRARLRIRGPGATLVVERVATEAVAAVDAVVDRAARAVLRAAARRRAFVGTPA